MKNKEENTDEPKTPESRLDEMEKSINSIKGDMSKILKAVQGIKKMDDDETEPGRQPQEEGDIEEEHDKKKNEGIGTTDVNPNPEGGDAKLPQAPAGETDETATPEGDKGDSLVEKKLADMKKSMDKQVEAKVQEVLKGMGITKSQTPRAHHESTDINKSNQKKTEFALDLLKRAKEGKLSMTDMNRETKDFVKGQYEDNIKKVLGHEVQ